MRVVPSERLTAYSVAGQVHATPQPRLSATYSLTEDLTLKTSAVRTVQFLHLLTSSDAGLPGDLWVPAGANTSPQKAWLLSAGADGALSPLLRWSIQGYWKKMSGLYRLKENSSPNQPNGLTLLDANTWENAVEKGTGLARGLEITVEKHKGKCTGWAGYSLSKSTRRFAGLSFPFRYDSPHAWTVAGLFPIRKNLTFSFNWLYQSGRPIPNGDEIGQNDVPFITLLNHSSLNTRTGRLPAYHRLDAGLNFYFSKNHSRHQLQISLYNAYNRKNVFFTVHEQDFFSGQTSLRAINGLPILPSLNYSVSWKNL